MGNKREGLALVAVGVDSTVTVGRFGSSRFDWPFSFLTRISMIELDKFEEDFSSREGEGEGEGEGVTIPAERNEPDEDSSPLFSCRKPACDRRLDIIKRDQLDKKIHSALVGGSCR